MSLDESERELLRRSREKLDTWTYEARDIAFTEFFEDEEPVATDEELQLLDRIDSDLTRQQGSGLWASDEYGIVATGIHEPGGLDVVCTHHPEIPYEGYRGEKSLDEATREQLNDVLWEYAERVARLIEDRLDAFLRSEGRDE